MAFYVIKQLEWAMNEDGDYAYARSPFGYLGSLTVVKEEGKWWACWSGAAAGAASINLDDVKAMAQKYHENCMAPLLKEV